MDNERKNLTDEELKAELNKGKTGKLGGSLLIIVGIIVTIIGLVSGPSIVVCIIGVIIAAIGSSAKGKAKDETGKKAFDAIVPELIARNFEAVEYSPREHILDAESSNIPLTNHSRLSRSDPLTGLSSAVMVTPPALAVQVPSRYWASPSDIPVMIADPPASSVICMSNPSSASSCSRV